MPQLTVEAFVSEFQIELIRNRYAHLFRSRTWLEEAAAMLARAVQYLVSGIIAAGIGWLLQLLGA